MALTNCAATLAADLQKNCADPIVGGIEKIGYLLNRNDVDIAATKASKVVGSQNLYASLVRITGKKGYGCTNLSNLKSSKVDGTYTNKIQHVITGALLDDGDIPGSIIDALTSTEGEFVMVIEHRFKDLARTLNPGSSAFQIIGLDVPLTSKGQAVENDKASADTDGGWAFNLATTEPKARAYWYSTSYTATKALFDALGTAAV